MRERPESGCTGPDAPPLTIWLTPATSGAGSTPARARPGTASVRAIDEAVIRGFIGASPLPSESTARAAKVGAMTADHDVTTDPSIRQQQELNGGGRGGSDVQQPA